MPIPIADHKYFTQKNGKSYLSFYAKRNLSDEEKKTLNDIVKKSNGACRQARNSSGKIGVRIYCVSSNSNLKEAIVALNNLFDINSYVDLQMRNFDLYGDSAHGEVDDAQGEGDADEDDDLTRENNSEEDSSEEDSSEDEELEDEDFGEYRLFKRIFESLQ